MQYENIQLFNVMYVARRRIETTVTQQNVHGIHMDLAMSKVQNITFIEQ